MRTQHWLLALTVCIAWTSVVYADDQPTEEAKQQAALFAKFEKTLSGATLKGRFTILGKDGPPREEEYTIESVKKIADQGDYWRFTARIKYGDKDITVPMPLQVKWAGDTPVITLSNLTIPGLGTFSSRVVIYNGKYAGTWTHGEVGGHLFGTIVPKAEEGKSAKDAAAPSDK